MVNVWIGAAGLVGAIAASLLGLFGIRNPERVYGWSPWRYPNGVPDARTSGKVMLTVGLALVVFFVVFLIRAP